MKFRINDYVTRKSYNNDIVFRIVDIQNNVAYLKGFKKKLLLNIRQDMVNNILNMKTETFALKILTEISFLKNSFKYR